MIIKTIIKIAAVDLYFVNNNIGIITSRIPTSKCVYLGNGIKVGTIES